MMETPGLRKGGDRVALLSSAETIPAPPGPAHSRFPGAPCSHRAILEPVLEVLAPMLGPAHMLAHWVVIHWIRICSRSASYCFSIFCCTSRLRP